MQRDPAALPENKLPGPGTSNPGAGRQRKTTSTASTYAPPAELQITPRQLDGQSAVTYCPKPQRPLQAPRTADLLAFHPRPQWVTATLAAHRESDGSTV